VKLALNIAFYRGKFAETGAETAKFECSLRGPNSTRQPLQELRGNQPRSGGNVDLAKKNGALLAGRLR
jgi:hypothetical protein